MDGGTARKEALDAKQAQRAAAPARKRRAKMKKSKANYFRKKDAFSLEPF